MIDRDAVDAILARLGRPDRDALPLLLRSLEDLHDPRDAWERLANDDRIPSHWIEDPARRFRSGAQFLAQPSTVDACAAIACDLAGVVRAEALAREFVQRIEPALGVLPTVVSWRVDGAHDESVDPRFDRDYRALLRGLWASDLSELVVEFAVSQVDLWAPRRRDGRVAEIDWLWLLAEQDDDATRTLELRDAPPRRRAVDRLGVWGAWQVLARDDVPVRPVSFGATDTTPVAWRNRRFSELPSPFDALFALYDTGYLLDAVGYDAIHLVAPAA